MTDFTVHTEETAPVASKAIMRNVKQSYGMLPNLMGVFAESPAAIEGYVTLMRVFDKSSFTPVELQIIYMTNNRLNGCTYCMAAHSTIARMEGVPNDVIETLRKGTSFADVKLEALHSFTAKVVENRGFVSDAAVDAFIAAGYSKANVLEVVLGASVKTLSNYTNHITKTPVDDAFQKDAWSADTSSAA